MRPAGPTAHTSCAPNPKTSSVPCHSSSGTMAQAAPSKCHIPTQLARYTSLAEDPQTPKFPWPPVDVGVHLREVTASEADALSPPVEAVIVAMPAARPVATPCGDTTAIDGSEVDQVTSRPGTTFPCRSV